MRASRLRESVVLQRWTGSAWVDAATLFAEIIPTGESQEGAAMDYDVSLRYGTQAASILPTKDLQGKFQLIWKSRTLDIFGAINVGQRNEEIRLRCRETLPETLE